MTDQERQLIEGLASRIANAPAPPIDRDADALIRQKVGARPESLYILTQTVLVQEMALEQAKQQSDELKRQMESLNKQVEELKRQSSSQTSSSGGGFLHTSSPSAQTQGNWGSAPVGGYAPGQGGNQPSQYPPPLPPTQQPQYGAPPSSYAPPQPPPASPAAGGMGGFLKTAATTAAGVVAGEAVFSGISSLFGGHHGGGGGFFGGGGGISPGSQTIIENIYEAPRDDYDRGDRGEESSFGRDNDRSNYVSPDIEDRRHDSFASAATPDVADDDVDDQEDLQSDDASNTSDDDTDDYSDNSDSSDDDSNF